MGLRPCVELAKRRPGSEDLGDLEDRVVTQEHRDHQISPYGESLAVKTFVSRTLRSTALRGEGELEIVTPFAVIRGRPARENHVGDLWHRTREQVSSARHEENSRIPSVEGGDLIELESVTVTPFASPASPLKFDDLVVFSNDAVAIRATVRPATLH
jgi:hypothetical protein